MSTSRARIQRQFGRARRRPDRSAYDVPGPALAEFAEKLKGYQALTTGTGRPNLLFEGVTLVEEDSGAAGHPWAPFAGMFGENPAFDHWRKAMADRRRALDEDPSVL